MTQAHNDTAPTKPPVLAVLKKGPANHELNFELWRAERLPRQTRERWDWFGHERCSGRWNCRGTITSPQDTAVKALRAMATHAAIGCKPEQAQAIEALMAEYLGDCPLTRVQGVDDFERTTQGWANPGKLHLMITCEPTVGERWRTLQEQLRLASPTRKPPFILYDARPVIDLQEWPENDVVLIADPKAFFAKAPAQISKAAWLREVLGWLDGRILVLPVTLAQFTELSHMAKDAWQENADGTVVQAPEALHARH